MLIVLKGIGSVKLKDLLFIVAEIAFLVFFQEENIEEYFLIFDILKLHCWILRTRYRKINKILK
jgi:hypothetical protein